MKKILVLIGGGDRDEVIFRTALAAAIPLSAHMNFLHVHVSAGIAAKYDSHVQFAVGDGLRSALDDLDTKAKMFSEIAAHHIREYCAALEIEIDDTPTYGKSVTANFLEEKDTTIERLVFLAQQSDLVVMGRAKQRQGLSPDTLERLVRHGGRPVILAATMAPHTLTGTVMVCWNESDSVARAVAAAMPILVKAKRVVFANVAKRKAGDTEALHNIARQFVYNGIGISADAQVIPTSNAGVSASLSATAEDCKADLIVMGAFGHSRFRELIFGSSTEELIQNADRPILLMH